MSFALPRVVRLGPLVGHLRDRRVIRSADKKCLRPRHVVGILYRPWVLAAAMSRSRSQRACHHGRLCPRREVRVWCLKDPGRPSLGARPVGGDSTGSLTLELAAVLDGLGTSNRPASPQFSNTPPSILPLPNMRIRLLPSVLVNPRGQQQGYSLGVVSWTLHVSSRVRL